MIPLLPYFLSYVGGILAVLEEYRNFIFPFFLPAASVIWGVIIFRKSRIRLRQATAFALLFLMGTLAPGWSESPPPADSVLNHLQEGRPALVEGELSVAPQSEPNRTRYIVKLNRLEYQEKSITVSGQAQLTLYHREPSAPVLPALSAGDLVRFDKVRLKRPRNFKNPGRFDYQAHLASQGSIVIGNVSRPRNVERIGKVPLPFWVSARESLRGHFLNTLEEHFSEEEQALLKGMILGEKHSLARETRDAYIATGLAHLLAVSGLHIGFVAAAAWFLLGPIIFYLLYRLAPDQVRSGRSAKVTAFLCIFPVLTYMVLVGAKISAVRAGVMVIVVLLSILINREKCLFSALLTAAFVILLWNPKAITEVSFQLSFMAVFSILFAFHHFFKMKEDAIDWLGEPSWFQQLVKGYPPLDAEDQTFTQKSVLWLQRLLAGTAFVSLAAILGTLPIIVFHFNRISLIGFFLNLLMVPLASVLIPLAFFAVAGAIFWPGLGALLSYPVSVLLKLFIFVPKTFAGLPHASVYVPTPPQFWCLLYYFVLFGGIYFYCRKPESEEENWLKGRSRSWLADQNQKIFAGSLALAVVGVFVWIVWPRFPLPKSETLSVTILDVGQGESIFIEFPNHETMLIDGGGFYKNALDVGKAVIAPFLWNQGLGRIDYIAATHPDNDHISGLESLVDFFPIGHFLDSPLSRKYRRIEKLHRKALEKNAKPITLQIGKSLSIGEVRLTPMSPGAEILIAGERESSPNNLSLVLRLQYREFSMLFTGDIEERGEEHLLAGPGPLETLFLKVPHHGSRTSSTARLIQAVRPQAVFFSSGHLNPWRHPHTDVVERYRKTGAEIWRTDINGAIQITTDGTRHHIRDHDSL